MSVSQSGDGGQETSREQKETMVTGEEEEEEEEGCLWSSCRAPGTAPHALLLLVELSLITALFFSSFHG